MAILIFKTDVDSDKKKRILASIFEHEIIVDKWTVDMEDVDNVLRIVCSENNTEEEVIDLIQSHELKCEVLEEWMDV